MRHVVIVRFEDGREATIVIDENNEVSVRGLRNIREVKYLGLPRD